MRSIRSQVSAFFKWIGAFWTGLKSDQKAGLIVAVLSLVVGIFALPTFNDWFASPEEKLAKLGYKKTYEDFWRAIINKHPEAVDLFSRAKVRLEPRDFKRIFDDRVFNAQVVETLRKGKSVDDAHCPTEIQSLAFYKTAMTREDKARLLKQICGKQSVINAIRTARSGEQSRIAEADLKNRKRPERQEACWKKYNDEGERRMISEASQFNILTPTTYTERQCVLAYLNRELLVNWRSLKTSNTFHSIVRNCCEKYDPLQPTVKDGLRTADEVIQWLSQS